MLNPNRLPTILLLILVFVLLPLGIMSLADYNNKSILAKTDNKICALPQSEIENLKTDSSQRVKKNGTDLYFITFRNIKTGNYLTAITVGKKFLGFISLDLGGQKTPTIKPIIATLNRCLISTPEKFDFWYSIEKLGQKGTSGWELQPITDQIQPTDGLSSSTFPVDTIQIGVDARPSINVDVMGKDGGYQLFEYPSERPTFDFYFFV